MAWSTARTTFFSREFTPTAADKAIKSTLQRKYVKELWILLASVVAFLTVVRVVRYTFFLIFEHLGG